MSHTTHIEASEITIRPARPEDAAELTRVAGRDTHELPAGPLLVATVSGKVRAAISMTDGSFVADPFHRTSELVQMLKIRAGATRAAEASPLRRRTRRRFAALRAA
jgi:hypothetical protein